MAIELRFWPKHIYSHSGANLLLTIVDNRRSYPLLNQSEQLSDCMAAANLRRVKAAHCDEAT
jgi:hypothetical protein